MAQYVWGYLPEYEKERDDILDAVDTVFRSGKLVLGPSVKAFEEEFAAYHGVEHCVGVAIAPNGDILAVNSLNGNLVEITPGGSQVAVKALDTSGSPAGAGALFGLAVAPHGSGLYYVDDAVNTLRLLH